MSGQVQVAGYRRPVSGIERAWIVADDLFGPFVNQMVLEGEGPLDPDAWQKAVHLAADANPGARAVLRGWLGWSRWDGGGPPPRLTVVDGSGWDGQGPEGAPWLQRPLDPYRGPTAEVVLMRGPQPRVALRTLHATMDGGGTLAWARDLFAALRGEPCQGHADVALDRDVARRVDVEPLPPPEDAWVPPTGSPTGPSNGIVWRRLSLPGPHKALLPRIAHAVAAHARSIHGENAPVRFDIPADLRRLWPELRSTANLTGMVSLEPQPSDTPEVLGHQIRDALDGQVPAASVLTADGLRHVPLWLMRAVARHRGRQHARTGRYGSTGVLSNLGRLDLTPFQGAGFRARRVLFIPPGTPVTALFMGISGHPEGTEVLCSVPQNLASDGRLARLMDRLRATFSG